MAVQLQRRTTLGVDPKLVLVFELSGSVTSGAFTAAGLRPLDARQGAAVVAFADDPQLAGFLERVDAYRNSPQDAERFSNEAFIDALETIRPYGPEDRLTERVRHSVDAADSAETLLVDLECWHPGDPELATSWLDELREAVREAGGEVLDTYQNDGAGLLLVRAKMLPDAIGEIAKLDQLARVDGVPELPAARTEAPRAAVEDLPSVDPPAEDAPLVAMIDSGVRSAHPLISPALADALTLTAGIPDGEDAHGHGTRIAGLLMHGDLDSALARDSLPRPPLRLLSLRVLDGDNGFPKGSLWEHEVHEAIQYAAEQGARVVNLSIGDPETRYRGEHSTPVAGLIDQLARELDLVVVVPTGNVHPAAYTTLDEELLNQYATDLIESSETTMLDPGPAALALTVGGVCTGDLAGTGSARPTATRRAIGQEGWPAPISRRGPGVDGSIKPELVAPSGSLAWDLELGAVVTDPALGSLSTSGVGPERLFDVDVGTSYAAPRVARAAAAVLARYPDLSANLVRALVLQSAADSGFIDALVEGTDAVRRRFSEKAVGHGVASLGRAIGSDARRTVLVAEGQIPVDGTHVYEVPIPSSFFEAGGSRGIDVALCFDPPTRVRRLDYMASKMEFYLVRGMTPEEIEGVFLTAEEGEAAAAEEEAAESDDGGDADEPSTPPSSLARRLVTFQPSGKRRSRGANQLGRRRFAQRLTREDGDTYHLVVQCRRRWAVEGSLQSYALAVCLWRSDDQPEIYEEIRERVEIPIEVPVEVEVQR